MKYLPPLATLRSLALAYARSLHDRSRAAVDFLGRNMGGLALAWVAIVTIIGSAKVLTALSPIRSITDLAALALPYLLIALAPIVGYRLARASFPAGAASPQPSFRLAAYGKWHRLDLSQAQAHPVFGPTGFMASLLIGMLLNIVIRSFEFMVAVPAMNSHAPDWGQAIFHVMAADVIVMNFFYMVCFVMALRTVPLFPRMLLFAWIMDLAMQLLIARHVAAYTDLPASVATALNDLLQGNVTKVLISAALWLPYLLLSERVNVTYRSRAARIG
ncbi:MAG: DUF2569 domain-containing protein [Novosphingobium sp.]